MSANLSNNRLRWHTIRRIAIQRLRDTVFGWGLYITSAAAVGIAALLIFNSVRFVGESSLNVLSEPFMLPLQIALSLAVLFVAIEATLAIARPREQGSLQILFFAPIDESILISGNFLAGLLTFGLFVLLTLPILLLLSWASNFVVPTQMLWASIPAIVVVSATVAFGLFVSAAAPSARAAVLILVAGILLLLGLQSAYTALLSIPPTNRFFDAFLFIRTILANVQTILAWLSPFRMIEVILKAAMNNDWIVLFRQLGISLIATVVWLFAAVRMLRRRGVLP